MKYKKVLENYSVQLSVKVFRKPWSIRDAINHLDFFNEVNNPEMKIDIVKIEPKSFNLKGG